MDRKRFGLLTTTLLTGALIFSNCSPAPTKVVSQEQPPVNLGEITNMFPVAILCLGRQDIPIQVLNSKPGLFFRFGETTYDANKKPLITIYNNNFTGLFKDGIHSNEEINTAIQIAAEIHELLHACVQSTRSITIGELRKVGVYSPNLIFLPDSKIVEIDGFTIKVTNSNENDYYKGIDDVINGFIIIETLEKNPLLRQGIDMDLYRKIVYFDRLPELIERWDIVKSDELIKIILDAKKTSDISSLISSLQNTYNLAGFSDEEFINDLNVYLAQE
jgi:hypothetical protein